MLDPVDIDEKQFFLSEVITSFILVPGEVPPIHLWYASTRVAAIARPILWIVQAWVGHFVKSISLP